MSTRSRHNWRFKMLKKITEGRIEGGNGFYIQVGRDLLEYSDGKTFIELDLGYDEITKKNYVYVWNDKTLTSREKINIAKNLKEAIKLLTGSFEII